MTKDQTDTFGSEAALQMDFRKLHCMFTDMGASDLYVKYLASNDNSKNQIYLGGDLSAINIIPVRSFDVFKPASQKSKIDSSSKLLRGNINFTWMDPIGHLRPAPGAKLILYPQYPEIRLSGFLQQSSVNLGKWMDVKKYGRAVGRYLILGTTDDGTVIGYLAIPGSALANEFDSAGLNQELAVLQKLGQPGVIRDTSRNKLLTELARIYRSSPISGQKLNGKTLQVQPYRAGNGGGYTLEAALGVSPNGYGEPDFEGWEVKAHGSNVVTLFTPEPDGGVYQSEGIKSFLVRYGYEDRRGRPDRINFGGVYRSGSLTKITGLTLRMLGYDAASGKFDPGGSIALVDSSDTIAAEWSYRKLLEHWNRKHAKAVYVTYDRTDDGKDYLYNYHPVVHLGIGTDFRNLLVSFSRKSVYLDPGIKMEQASSEQKVKKRNQFRIKANDLEYLYNQWEKIDVSELLD